MFGERWLFSVSSYMYKFCSSPFFNLVAVCKNITPKISLLKPQYQNISFQWIIRNGDMKAMKVTMTIAISLFSCQRWFWLVDIGASQLCLSWLNVPTLSRLREDLWLLDKKVPLSQSQNMILFYLKHFGQYFAPKIQILDDAIAMQIWFLARTFKWYCFSDFAFVINKFSKSFKILLGLLDA